MTDDDRQRWLRELGARLKTARLAAGLTLEQVGEQLGSNRQLISHREHAISEIPSSQLARFAEITGADAGWLLTGTATPDAPLASPREILTIAAALEDDPKAQWQFKFADMGHRRVPIRTPASDRVVAVQMPDRSLEPEIGLDDIAVVNLDVRPAPGDVAVVALLKTGEVIIRRIESTSRGSISLIGTNPLFEPRKVAPAYMPWAAKVVEVSRVYQPQSTGELAGRVSPR
jgi:transcriptional regulator with XRE-family HTH domain